MKCHRCGKELVNPGSIKQSFAPRLIVRGVPQEIITDEYLPRESYYPGMGIEGFAPRVPIFFVMDNKVKGKNKK